MKLGPVTKLDKGNKKPIEKYEDDVMLVNCDVIFIFVICGQFGAIRKPELGRIVCKTCIFNIVTFYLAKTENRTNTAQTQVSHYCFGLRCYFYQLTRNY